MHGRCTVSFDLLRLAMSTSPSPPQVACPHCQAPSEFSDANAYRPFCSERCQLIDLGDWFDEEHRIYDDSPSIT
ncbi:MAG: DNA gyrase inhibitor YacG [Pseudomonadota bacterium]